VFDALEAVNGTVRNMPAESGVERCAGRIPEALEDGRATLVVMQVATIVMGWYCINRNDAHWAFGAGTIPTTVGSGRLRVAHAQKEFWSCADKVRSSRPIPRRSGRLTEYTETVLAEEAEKAEKAEKAEEAEEARAFGA